MTFVAQEGLLKSSDMPEISDGHSAFDQEHLVWFFGLFCRLVLLVLLTWTAGYSVFILISLATSQGGDSGETVWWSFLATIFGIMLLVSLLLVNGAMFERPLVRMAANLHLSGLVALLNFVNRMAEAFARRTFGIGSPNSYKEATETDPRIKILQESMVQVTSSTKESIMRGIDASEQRIKANASAVAETFFGNTEGMRSDHENLRSMRNR